MESFKLLHTALIYDRIPVSEYISERTGITVIIADEEGPAAIASFHLITEPDNVGLPGALRRLVFMGSEQFPYKDVPCLMINDGFGNFSKQVYFDHTAYTVETIFAEELFTLLPIIGDYILFPLLNEESFLTEVHHITGEGEDAGGMYEDVSSEESEIDIYHSVRKYVYPKGCSYAANPYGTKKSVRESVTLTKIKEYHEKFYRPENLKIIVIGSIKPEKVFESLQKLEDKIVSKGQRDDFQRPLQPITLPPMESSKNLEITVPSDKETHGTFYIAWRTLSCIEDSYTILGLSMLLNYLTECSTSPLLKELVESDDPFARSVYSFKVKNKASCLCIVFENVPVKKLSQIEAKFQEVLLRMVKDRDIDMKRMETIIETHKMKRIITLEQYPSYLIQCVLMRYLIYGNAEDFQRCLNPLPELERLLEEPQTFWLDLIQKYLVENHRVSVQIIPNKQVKRDMAKKEKERLEAQKRNLTEDELKAKGDELRKAVEWKNRKPPSDVLITPPFPNIDCIKFGNIERYSSNTEHNQRIDLSQTPVLTFFDHITTSTVYLQVFVDTSDVPNHLLNYLPLLFEALLELPIEQGGSMTPHEEIVRQLEADTIYRWTDSNYYRMPHTAAVCVEVEADKFDVGLTWFKKLLYQTRFTAERLTFVAKKMVAELKEDLGSATMYDAVNAMCFRKDSPAVIRGDLQRQKFLTSLIEKLSRDDCQKVLDDIEAVRRTITEPSKLTLYIAGSLDYLKDPGESINLILPPDLKPNSRREKLGTVFDYNFLDFDDSLTGCIIGADYAENDTWFCQVTKGVTSYLDPDYAALSLYVKYQGRDEGPLAGQVPDFKFFFDINISEGLLQFYCTRLTSLVDNYRKVKEILSRQIETRDWDPTLFERSKRETLCEILWELNSRVDLHCVSRQCYLFDLDFTYRKKLLESVMKLTTEDLNRVGEKYVSSLFDQRKSKTVVITHPSKLVEVDDGFKELGFDFMVYPSVEESFLNTL